MQFTGVMLSTVRSSDVGERANYFFAFRTFGVGSLN